MRIKITEKGWAGFTGHMGSVEFVDGISVDDIGQGDAAHLASLISVENVANGQNPSVAQRLIDVQDVSMPVEKQVVASIAAPSDHSKESLEKIADAQGIKGVREIAEPMGLKGNSISELIDKVLKAQSEAAVAAAAAQTAA